MDINQIKKEALRLMFATYSDTLKDNGEERSVDEMTEENYTQYLANMDGAINRCLKRLESVGAVQRKTVAFILPFTDDEGKAVNCGYVKKALPSDCRKVDRVVYSNSSTYYFDEDHPFKILSGDIVLKAHSAGTYEIVYFPKVQIQVSYPSNFDLSQMGIGDEFAVLIPYYIKAELYEEDEPAQATQARNLFEALLADTLAMNIEDNKLGRVVDIWSD